MRAGNCSGTSMMWTESATDPRRWCWFFFSSRRRHTRLQGDWSSDVCSSDLGKPLEAVFRPTVNRTNQKFLQGECEMFRPGKTKEQTQTTDDTADHTPQSSYGSSKIGRASCRERV